VLWKAGGKLLVDVQLFDIYRGEQIKPELKSLAYALMYQAPDRTLTDKEVAKLRTRILKQLDVNLGAKLRE
jgi:phenylalanyl-tRNA synthetase beta chain